MNETLSSAVSDTVHPVLPEPPGPAQRSHRGFPKAAAAVGCATVSLCPAVAPAASPMPEESPYLTDRFVSAAFAVPLADRYRADLPTGYWRCKSLVLSLLPSEQALFSYSCREVVCSAEYPP